MALVPCKECKKEISSAARICPSCGAKQRMHPLWWVLIVPAGLFAMMMVFGLAASNSPEGQEKARSRDAIALCWEDQKRKSFDPSTARFVAGACEMMEQKFRARFGVSP